MFYEKRCIKLLVNKCNVLIIYWGDKYLMGCFAKVHSLEILNMFCWTKFLFFLSNLSMTLPFHSMSTDLFMQCLRHVSKQSLSSSLKVDLTFPHKILLVSLYLGRLVNKFFRILFPMSRKSPVTICPWFLSIKPELT